MTDNEKQDESGMVVSARHTGGYTDWCPDRHDIQTLNRRWRLRSWSVCVFLAAGDCHGCLVGLRHRGRLVVSGPDIVKAGACHDCDWDHHSRHGLAFLPREPLVNFSGFAGVPNSPVSVDPVAPGVSVYWSPRYVLERLADLRSGSVPPRFLKDNRGLFRGIGEVRIATKNNPQRNLQLPADSLLSAADLASI